MKTILLDATQLTYVAFFAERLEEAESIDEMEARLAVGILSRVLRYGIKTASNRFAFCWDSPRSVRHDMYPAYKMNRHKEETQERRRALRMMFTAAADLRENVFPAAGFSNQWLQDGLEADDLMAKGAADLETFTVIVTSDEDLLQCLSPSCWLFHPTSLEYTTMEDFEAEYGISPPEWATVKAIAGCPGDNVIGVAGVAEPTAARFILGTLGEKSSKYRAIVEDMDGARERLPLVKLPHSFTAPVRYRRNSVTVERMREALASIGADAYLADRRVWSHWEKLVAGKLEDTTSFKAVLRAHQRRQRKAEDPS